MPITDSRALESSTVIVSNYFSMQSYQFLSQVFCHPVVRYAHIKDCGVFQHNRILCHYAMSLFLTNLLLWKSALSEVNLARWAFLEQYQCDKFSFSPLFFNLPMYFDSKSVSCRQSRVVSFLDCTLTYLPLISVFKLFPPGVTFL